MGIGDASAKGWDWKGKSMKKAIGVLLTCIAALATLMSCETVPAAIGNHDLAYLQKYEPPANKDANGGINDIYEEDEVPGFKFPPLFTRPEHIYWTAMAYAAAFNDVDAMGILFAKGADINKGDIDTNASPLILATVYGNNEAIKFLLKENAQLYLVTKTPRGFDGPAPGFHPVGLSALDYAIVLGNTALAKEFIEAGAPVNPPIFLTDPNADGAGPLHLAALYGDTDIVELLLSKAANVNQMDRNGNTPLHYVAENAVPQERQDAARKTLALLIDKGADIRIVNAKGQTPLDVAYAHNWQGIAHDLEKYREMAENKNQPPLAVPTPAATQAQSPAPTIAPAVVPSVPQPPASASTKSPQERMTELKNMLDAGLISQAEYDQKKADILSQL
jgi:ankyrin repeat protein